NTAQTSTPSVSSNPRRNSTRLPAAALSQNNIGNAAAPAITTMACIRPRMMNSARARMRSILTLYRRTARLTVVAVGVGQQGQEAGALDSGGQLALIACFGSGDTAWNDLAGFGNVGFQSVEILVIDLFHVFSGETAELTTTEKTCHEIGSSIDPWITRQRWCRCCRCRCHRFRWHCQFQGGHDAHGARYGFPQP